MLLFFRRSITFVWFPIANCESYASYTALAFSGSHHLPFELRKTLKRIVPIHGREIDSPMRLFLSLNVMEASNLVVSG